MRAVALSAPAPAAVVAPRSGCAVTGSGAGDCLVGRAAFDVLDGGAARGACDADPADRVTACSVPSRLRPRDPCRPDVTPVPITPDARPVAPAVLVPQVTPGPQATPDAEPAPDEPAPGPTPGPNPGSGRRPRTGAEPEEDAVETAAGGSGPGVRRGTR